MSNLDINGIAVALAAQYASLTPPTGEDAIHASTADPPQTITHTPFVLATLAIDEQGSLEYGGGLRSGRIPFTVDFYLSKAADLARTEVRLRKWLPVLLDATLVNTHLGLASQVASHWTTGFELGDLTYGGTNWAAIRLSVMVQTSDGISPTA